ncbi:Ribosomal protein L35 [Candidatus Omnitrophus magneticus]|uniref:Large ribosomal subunit protein bL35 n=1 Tax=Candidatus Omnitrophus magneticus TaxID=1609969 RepID=A0A0F0CX75_9BACT|nr:Ribosomal protein L35 [Candidatus Omnitrophus magneticus]
MPKLKTNKGVRKRFKVSKRGKVLRAKAGRRHLLTGKSRKRKRSLRQPAGISPAQTKTIKAMLPYS